jgi:hypothetical protein
LGHSKREFDEKINFDPSHEGIGFSANERIRVLASVELTLIAVSALVRDNKMAKTLTQ